VSYSKLLEISLLRNLEEVCLGCTDLRLGDKVSKKPGCKKLNLGEAHPYKGLIPLGELFLKYKGAEICAGNRSSRLVANLSRPEALLVDS
jgi:hypothetical protein